MKKTLFVFLMMTVLTLNACTPLAPVTSTALPRNEPVTTIERQVPASVPSPQVNPVTNQKTYTNNTFGLSFKYPSNWFGTGEYVSDGTLRVEVGSDRVYPYGEPPAQPSDVKNSYNVVIQYAKNNQNSSWKGTYQSLLNLKDGESLASSRSLLIRVRQLNIGKFTGFEYITTLPETAQTDHVYIRSVMLLDEQTNDLLTIMGQPNNVEFSSGTQWRAVYQTLDEANLIFFHEIVESITIK